MITTAQRLFILALAPLVLMGALRPTAGPDSGLSVRAIDEARLELATLKAEARSLVVHIDGP